MNKVVKKLLLATVGVWDPIWIRWYRIKTGEVRPIPPFKNRDRIGARDIGWFLHSGEADYTIVKDAIVRWQEQELAALSILDFGAGCGRILQHFLPDNATLAASDVDPTAIRYLNRALPPIKAVVNQSVPPIAFKSELFDCIYAFSVWTHLPVDLQNAWLSEAHRILLPHGLLLVSTMGFQALKLLREGNNPLEQEWQTISDDELRAQGAIYYEYPIFGQDDELFSGISASYGVAVHDPEYIRRAWSDRFKVLEIREGAFRQHQDLVVLRKK